MGTARNVETAPWTTATPISSTARSVRSCRCARGERPGVAGICTKECATWQE